MGILSIDEISDDRAGAADTGNGRSYVRRFRVLTDTPAIGPHLVGAATGIRFGDRYGAGTFESDQYAYCTSIEASQEEGDALGWIVTATYGAFDAITAGGGPDNNPLLMPIDIEWSFRNQEKVCQYDVNNKAILNTANDPFDPPLIIDDPRPLLTVVRNEAIADIEALYSYRNAVNSDPFGPWGPQMARVVNIRPKSLFHQYVGWYWQVTYEFEFNPPDGYRPKVLNMGMRKISQTTNQPVPIVLNGVPVSQPMLLTQFGYLAKPTDEPYWLQFQVYNELPFDYFGFDNVAISGLRSGFNTTSAGSTSNPVPGGS